MSIIAATLLFFQSLSPLRHYGRNFLLYSRRERDITPRTKVTFVTRSDLSPPVLICSILLLLVTSPAFADNLLFEERFEDTNLSARGWYDNTTPNLSSTEHVANSTKSLEFHFAKGATKPDNGALMRKQFPNSDSVHIRYNVKYSSNWEGSNVSYHPHEFYLLTNKDSAWTGPAYTRLTVYIEQNEGKPRISIQDGVNIDQTRIGTDLTNVTENRSVAGCNGDSDGYGVGDCYLGGADYRNGKRWISNNILFSDATGPNYKNDWHVIEAYVKLNSITDGKSNNDGILQYWFDGTLVLDHKDVVFRTALNSDMNFNQFLIGPYIGVGAPVDQTFWVDDLILTTGITNQLTPPQNFRIVNQE